MNKFSEDETDLSGGQTWLINLMQKLGLKSNPSGVCYGVAHTAMQSREAGELKLFTQRFEELRNFSLDEEKVESLKNKLRNSESEEIMSVQERDFSAFLQTIEVYHQLYEHPELQAEGARTSAQSAIAALPIVKPVAIESMEKDVGKKLEPINLCISAYPEDNIEGEGFTLESYFEKTKSIFSESKEPVSLILGSGNHIIFVSYDNTDKQWTLIDPYSVPDAVISQEESKIAAAVSESFKGEGIIFNATIWGYKDDQLQNAADGLKQTLENERSAYLSTLDEDGVSDYIDLTDYHGNTQLFVAASFNDIDTAKSLLKEEADVDIQNDRDFTALQIAIQNGHEEIASLIIDSGADVDIEDSDGNTPLHIAAKSGNKEIVARLLKNDAPFYLENKRGETPLLIAYNKGHSNVVNQFLDKGAFLNINSLDVSVRKKLENNLKEAVKEGNVENTTLFLKLGVSPDLRYAPWDLPDHNQVCSLVEYAQASKNEAIVEVLVNYGADPGVDLSKESSGPPQKPLPIPPEEGQQSKAKSHPKVLSGPPQKPLPIPSGEEQESAKKDPQGSQKRVKAPREVSSTPPAKKLPLPPVARQMLASSQKGLAKADEAAAQKATNKEPATAPVKK